MPPILVSACLLGQPVRYDGRAGEGSELLLRWQQRGWLQPLCPEMAGGLPVPRPAAEIHGPGGGAAVLRGQIRLRVQQGPDPTEAFIAGAQAALALAQRHGCRYAVLTERSPSCGSTHICDGSFSRRLIEGEGLTTALLRQHGIEVFSQHQLDELAQHLPAH
ncbi:DUF523 domain-containing protein [Paucibacter sp. APW11]|uniref:DUF523 domain-containing protein n=1 Tax=Roseateles aquae TaxID=3077235 RepID=A0ABU3PAK8_9BURK|nr:DUF523 domain-containing protein [Paucibacter sp. APW11]MDT8999255.1 DUF523 domain-containing protein [Paucibacter sp. APW11]